MISTNEFSFTNAEVGFIKKNFQRKYPAVMGDFIDHARELMKAIQTRSKDKLVYSAHRYFPENSPRYHISEALFGQSEQGSRMYISVHPVEPSKKALFGANNKGPHADSDIARLLVDLTELSQVQEANYTQAQTFTGVPMPFVIEQLLAFVTAVKDEAVVQLCDISLDAQSYVVLDLSHKASRSHYLQLRFDFSLPSAQ